MARTKNEPKNKEWIELCEYVKKEILQYDDNMKFPTYLALKLQGLKKGQHIANNNIESGSCYDAYMEKNETKIKDERHRINLIIKIVEPEINDVYIRLKQAQKREEKIVDTSFDNQFNNGAKYTKKTHNINERMKKLF